MIFQWSPSMVYLKEKQQLLVTESNPVGLDTEREIITIHVFHLSPCNLETKKLMKNLQ